ncbi:hypothetical protein GCM10025868_24620 [Angustibacter aerolatus]|uniref:Methyltransferase FkbM domain-containing protein n=1 Tax=Angustibacter aerolatus TaxID=1162965 RepID=A0ABQ6JK19_9ACTN|nr:hypothetical protein GCM10025868_24620 [Angustibacter aerolatus]
MLDVGANVGQFARSIRDGGYTGRIVSFEPVPVHAAQARAGGRGRPGLDGATGGARQRARHRLDAGAARVQARSATRTPTAASASRPSTTTAPRWSRCRCTGSTRSWTSLLEPLRAAGVEHPRVYLKTDTQGYDLEVFRGLGDRVRDVVAMQAEASLLSIYDGAPRLPEAMTAYEQAGFALTGCYPVSREADGRVIEPRLHVRPHRRPGRDRPRPRHLDGALLTVRPRACAAASAA